MQNHARSTDSIDAVWQLLVIFERWTVDAYILELKSTIREAADSSTASILPGFGIRSFRRLSQDRRNCT